jgi:GT2 family glycosyltransferase
MVGMMLSYHHPEGVREAPGERPMLTTAEGGFVAVDNGLLQLWRVANGRTFEQIASAASHDVEDVLPAAVACLAEARLLTRSPEVTVSEPPLRPLSSPLTASAVIIVSTPGELVWLEPCVSALLAQRHSLETVLVVDNGVGVDMEAWLRERALDARVHSLPRRTNFASALNAGVAAPPASDYLLLMNADMRAHPHCVGNLLARAEATPKCAAVATKLYLWRAPAFLNGIGNRVPGWGYGTDNGMGQLDLGQLDGWTEVPSGCLGCMLVSRTAIADVGEFDQAYPLYYEDTDWSYRARLQGYTIAAAPDAHVHHAFGATWSGAAPAAMHSGKLASAIFGQLRFAMKIGSPGRAALLGLHAVKDARVNIAGAIRNRDKTTLGAYAKAAARTIGYMPSTITERLHVQRRRALPDRELFKGADDLTPSFVWNNLPELTTASVRTYYAPLIAAGRTRPLPEAAAAPV